MKNIFINRILAVIMIALLCCSVSFAVEYTVGHGGADFDNIQGALDALPPEGGIVTVSPGRYVVDQTIKVPSNTTLQGVGWDVIIEPTIDIGKRQHPNNRVITNANVGSGGNSNIIIRDLAIDGKGLGIYHGDAIYGISLEGCWNSIIERCYVHDVSGEGILTAYIAPGHAPIIIRNNLVINATHGINPHFTSTVQVIGNTLRQNRGLGIFCEAASDVTIENNLVDRNGGGGIVWMGNYSGSTYDTHTCSILNNTIVGNAAYGIFVHDAHGRVRDVEIKGNVCADNNNIAIRADKISRIIIKENTVSQPPAEVPPGQQIPPQGVSIWVRDCKFVEEKNNITALFIDTFTGVKADGWSNAGYYVWNDGTDDRCRRDGTTPYANVDQNVDFNAPDPNTTAINKVIWEVDLYANPDPNIVGVPIGGHQHGLQWNWSTDGYYQCRLMSQPGVIEYIEYDGTGSVVDFQTYALPVKAGQWMITKIFNLKIIQDDNGHDVFVNNEHVARINDMTLREGSVGLAGIGVFDNVKAYVPPLKSATSILFEDTFTIAKKTGWWNDAYIVTNENRVLRDDRANPGPPNIDQYTTYSAPLPNDTSKIIWELTVFAHEGDYGFGLGGANGGLQWSWISGVGAYQMQVRHFPGNYAFVEYMQLDGAGNTIDYYPYWGVPIDFGTVKTYYLKVIQDTTGHDMYINDIWLGRIDDSTLQGGGIGMFGQGLFDDARISISGPALQGDLNYDGVVDYKDLALLAENWLLGK